MPTATAPLLRYDLRVVADSRPVLYLHSALAHRGEITVESTKRHMGLDVTLVTSAQTDDEGRELLKLLGMPFRRTEPVPAKTTAAATRGLSQIV